MAKMYAWTHFRTKVNEWGQVVESVKPGDEVTKAKLKVDDDKWESFIAQGLVRPEKYPDIPRNVSPAEHATKLKAAKQRGEAEAPMVVSERVEATTPAPAPVPVDDKK